MQNQRIYSLAGLKVIAIWLIFWWHSWLTNPPCDLGARCCEFFFVASGFLVYYTHKDSSSCTWGDSLRYISKKLVTIWPMHLLAFILCLFSMSAAEVFTQATAIKGLINLLLLQSWIDLEQIFFSFNGPSWFLSSLLFCYFLTPVLLRLVRNKRKAWIYFPIVFLIRYAIEESQFYYPNAYTDLNIHVSPVLRMMEFFLGLLICCIWSSFQEWSADKRKALSSGLTMGIASVVELIALFLTGTVMLTKQNSWGRDIFVLWFCLLVFVFAFDAGIISHLFATKPIQWFASIQFEFFIFHIPVINLVTRYIAPYGLSGNQLAAIAFLIVLLLSWLYSLLLKKPAERLMQRVLNICCDWIRN